MAAEAQRDRVVARRHEDAEAIDVERERDERTIADAGRPRAKETLIDE
jgi:hypothetical protein